MLYRERDKQEAYAKRYALIRSKNIPDVVELNSLAIQDQTKLFNSLLPGDIIYCGEKSYMFMPDYRYQNKMFLISLEDDMLHPVKCDSITKIQFVEHFDVDFAEMFFLHSCLLRAMFEPDNPQAVFSRMKDMMTYTYKGTPPADGFTALDEYVSFGNDTKHAIYLGLYDLADLAKAFPDFDKQYQQLLAANERLAQQACQVYLLESGEFLVGCSSYTKIVYDVQDEWWEKGYMHQYLAICNSISKQFHDFVEYVNKHSYKFPARNLTHFDSISDVSFTDTGRIKFIIGFADMSLYTNKSNEKTNVFSE